MQGTPENFFFFSFYVFFKWQSNSRWPPAANFETDQRLWLGDNIEPFTAPGLRLRDIALFPQFSFPRLSPAAFPSSFPCWCERNFKSLSVTLSAVTTKVSGYPSTKKTCRLQVRKRGWRQAKRLRDMLRKWKPKLRLVSDFDRLHCRQNYLFPGSLYAFVSELEIKNLSTISVYFLVPPISALDELWRWDSQVNYCRLSSPSCYPWNNDMRSSSPI